MNDYPRTLFRQLMNIINHLLKDGAKTNNPRTIIIHSMGQYIKDTSPIYAPDFLEKYGLSAHALIDPSGDILICRTTDQGAYHARGFNKDSLGIEFLVEGEHDYASFIERIKKDYITKTQWAAGVELVKHWISMYDITDIRRHSDVSPGRKVDPGSGFKWDKFINEIRR